MCSVYMWVKIKNVTERPVYVVVQMINMELRYVKIWILKPDMCVATTYALANFFILMKIDIHKWSTEAVSFDYFLIWLNFFYNSSEQKYRHCKDVQTQPLSNNLFFNNLTKSELFITVKVAFSITT